MRARKMSAAGEMPYLGVFNMHWHSRKVMRECWLASRMPIQKLWDFRTLRTCGHIGSRKLAVKQLSNSELLRIIRQDKEDATSTATAQNNSDDLDLQELDILQQRESLLAAHSPQLPQSPFIDRGLIAARIRRKAVKPLPSGDRSPFQLKLQKNPYGINALVCKKKNPANRHCSHCISDSTSTMRLNRPSTAKLLSDSLWRRDTSENWGTMAPSKAPIPSSVRS